MPHILHVIDTTGPGGAETVFIEVADRVRALGFESTVVVRGPGWVLDEVRRRNLDVYVIEAKGTANIAFVRSVLKLIRTRNIDLIQSHLLGSNLYCAIISALCCKPVIATFHGMVDVANTERFMALKFTIMNLFVRRYVAVSERLLNIFEQKYKLSRGKTKVIYNGVDTANYGLTKSNRLRTMLNIPEQSQVFGCLGNVRPAKAYDVMTHTVAECVGRGIDLHVLVAGDPKARLMTALTRLAETLKVQDRIHYIGFIDDSAEFLSNVDAFLLSSSSEGFSISTIEAMSAGLPVVATRCGGPEEIIEHEKTGWLVENGSVEAIANAIETVVKQPELAQSIATQAQIEAREKFDSEAMVSQYIRLYKTALS
ncbi:MAG: glycosyltransferase family 4 protein [Pseudomonadales bacterium]